MSAYFVSYPLKVFFASEDLDVFRPIAGVALLAFLLRQGARSRLYPPVRFARRSAAVVCVLCSVVAGYYFNALAFEGEPLLRHSLYKHTAFATVIVLLLCFRGQIAVFVPSRSLERWMTLLSVATFAAVVLNAFGHRIPDGAELNEKYYVGSLLRAGAGYLDPNFLSINVAGLFFTVLMLTDKASRLRRVNTSLLLATLFLTFSRGALVFIGITLVLRAITGSRPERRLVVFGGVALAAGIIVLQVYDAGILFRRFTDSEGASSTSDRLFQYSSALKYLAEHLEVQNIVVGFGGLDFFFRLYGVHLHNYFLATIFEAGLAPAIALTVCFTYFFRTAETSEAKLYLIFAGLQLMVLPDNPDPLYLGFALSLVAVRLRPARFPRRLAGAVPVPVSP